MAGHRILMRAATLAVAVGALAMTAGAAFAQAQQPAGSPAQREAMDRLDFMNGEWRGDAWSSGPGGRVDMTQTERVGDMLGGSVKVIEGRGYSADGETVFNAFAVVSWDEESGYTMRAYSSGRAGDFPLELTDDGFKWSTPAGPNARVDYTAVVADGRWHEVGDYVVEGRPPVRFIELNLTRVGDSDWPGAGAVSPR